MIVDQVKVNNFNPYYIINLIINNFTRTELLILNWTTCSSLEEGYMQQRPSGINFKSQSMEYALHFVVRS